MTDRTPNARLAYAVLDQIDAEPELWDQLNWLRRTPCGTVACFAGHAVLLAGAEVTYSSRNTWEAVTFDGVRYTRISEAACAALGIDDDIVPSMRATYDQDDRAELFDANNTREDLGLYVKAIFGDRPEG